MRWCGVAITPALLTRRWSGWSTCSAARRTDARSETSIASGCSFALGISWLMPAMVASSLAGLRAPRMTSAPWRASSRTVSSPIPLVTPVTRARLPLRSGMSAGLQLAVLAHGVTASASSTRRPSSCVALDPRLGRLRRSATSGQHDEVLGAQRHGRGGLDVVVHGSRAAVVADAHAPAQPGVGHLEAHGGAGRWRHPLADHHRQAAPEGAQHVVGHGAVVAAGPADRPPDVLLVHPHVEGPVAEQGLVVPRDVTGGPRRRGLRVGGWLGLELGVARGDGLLDLVGERLHVAVAAGEHALLGVVVHQALQVRGLRDLDRLLGAAGQHGLEVGGVRDVVLDAPAVEVGGQVPLLARDLAGEGHELGAGLVPDLDQLGQARVQAVPRGAASVMADSVRRPACPR